MKKLLLFSLFIYLTLSFSGCKKTFGIIEPQVPSEPQPTISFSFTQGDYGVFGFNATSTNATTYKWNFGDGGTDYSLSPTHYYKKNGSYDVNVTATGKGGSTTTNRSIYVSTATGDVSFWSNNIQYPVNVTFDNKYLSTIKNLYSSTPNCDATGTAYFPLQREGTHTYTAKEVGRLFPRTWSGSVTVVSGECSKIRLYIN